MSDQLDIDNERGWGLIDQFAAGDVPEAERAWMAQWVVRTPEAVAVVNALRKAQVVCDGDSVAFDVAGVRERAAVSMETGLPNQVPARRKEGQRKRTGQGYLGAQPLLLRISSLRRSIWSVGGALLALIAVALAWPVHRPTTGVTRKYVTRSGQQAIVTLDDGTRVTLLPNTTLRLLTFGVRERRLSLDGDAYIQVSHASGLPFVVRCGNATVRVLGTGFFIRHLTGTTQLHVAVAEGRVRVTPSANGHAGVTLAAGQVGEVRDSTVHVGSIEDLAPNVEWARDQLMFRDTPLMKVLATVSRWYGYQFKYADPTLPERIVTLAVSTQSSMEALAEIERVLHVNLSVVGDTITLVPQPRRQVNGTPRIHTYDAWTPAQEVGR